MKSDQGIVWLVALAGIFIGGLILLAHPKHTADVKRSVAGQEWVFKPIPSPTYIDPRDQNRPLRPDGTFAEIVAPHSDPKHPPTQPEYPAWSKQIKEAGTVIMLLTVAADGHVSDAVVDQTSGSDRLDRAAVVEALKWRLVPGTIDGTPTAMQYKFAVTFKLED